MHCILTVLFDLHDCMTYANQKHDALISMNSKRESNPADCRPERSEGSCSLCFAKIPRYSVPQDDNARSLLVFHEKAFIDAFALSNGIIARLGYPHRLGLLFPFYYGSNVFFSTRRRWLRIAATAALASLDRMASAMRPCSWIRICSVLSLLVRAMAFSRTVS